MKTIHKIFVGGDTTDAQVAAQVSQCLIENPSGIVEVIAEFPDWKQARAALVAGANDYLPVSLG